MAGLPQHNFLGQRALSAVNLSHLGPGLCRRRGRAHHARPCAPLLLELLRVQGVLVQRGGGAALGRPARGHAAERVGRDNDLAWLGHLRLLKRSASQCGRSGNVWVDGGCDNELEW